MGKRLQRQDSVADTTSAYNAADMLLSSGGNAYTSDADGNTLTGANRMNTWDSQNRLVSCLRLWI